MEEHALIAAGIAPSRSLKEIDWWPTDDSKELGHFDLAEVSAVTWWPVWS